MKENITLNAVCSAHRLDKLYSVNGGTCNVLKTNESSLHSSPRSVKTSLKKHYHFEPIKVTRPAIVSHFTTASSTVA
jgi:hypothetical protein